MKNHKKLPALILSLMLPALMWASFDAKAQGARSVIGSYSAVSSAPFGDNPRGQLMLGADGRYSLVLARKTLPKFASGSRSTGTAEENKAIVGGSIAHFGTYVVDSEEKTITFKIEGSTYPNWDGETFKRPLKLTADQLTYTNSSPSDGSGANDVIWKRVK